MADSPMDVDTDSLMNAAKAIARDAEDLGTELQDLQTTVTSESPWGDDEQGTLFGGLYMDVLGHAMETYASHEQLLVTAASGLAEWSQNTAQYEQEATEHIKDIGSEIGG